MTRTFEITQHASPPANCDEPATLTIPTPFLTSEGKGWVGLEVMALHEPLELDGFIAPGIDEISLVLFTRGAMDIGSRFVRGGSWKEGKLRKGDLLLTPDESPTRELRWKSISSEPIQSLRLLLSKDLFAQTAQELSEQDPSQLVLVERSGFQDPLLTHIALSLERELKTDTPIGKLYAETAAQMLAVHLLRHYTSIGKEVREPTQQLTHRQIRQVTDFIQEHLNQDLSLEMLAQQISFSTYYFARLFHRATGESPHQFVLRQRIERAQRLIQETDMPLALIALETGFANQSHLGRVFKRQLGLTPHTYRQDQTM